MAKVIKKTRDEFITGWYVSDKNFKVIKKLDTESSINREGKIERTFGVWPNDSRNFYDFKAGKKIQLNADDMKNETIKQLILNGKIRRTL